MKEILNFPYKNKLKRYKKWAKTIFKEVSTLVDRLQNAVNNNQAIWELIKIVVVADLPYINLDYIVRLILYTDDKTLEQIEQIVIFIEQINLVDRTISVTSETVMIFRLAKNKVNNKYFLYKCKRYHTRKYPIRKQKQDDNLKKEQKMKREIGEKLI